jgi:conjugal transfer/type IV secretion protein DotA/TraY
MFKNIGDYAMTFSSTIIAGQAAGKVAMLLPGPRAALTGIAGAADKAGFLEPLKQIGGAVMTVAWTLLVVGLIMSLYIPLIPFIVWMGACLSYAASFIEGLIAMPLHSFSHLDTDGEGLGQKTGHGYLFMLNTLTRPALMVLSFFIASSLVVIMGTFQAALFIPAMNNMQGNSVTGMFSIIGLILIFLVINVTLINACFELINLIPDQVIGFIGAGNVNTRLGSDTEGKINGIFLNVARGAQGGLASALKPTDDGKGVTGKKPPGSEMPKLK